MKDLYLITLMVLAVLGQGKAMAQPQFQFRSFDKEPGYFYTPGIADIKSDRDNHIWVVRFSGIQHYDGKEFIRIRPTTPIKGLPVRFYEKPNGEKMVVDHRNEFFYIQGDSLAPYPMNDSLAKLTNYNGFCSDFYFDEEDRLHIALRGKGYLTIDRDFNIEWSLEEELDSLYGVVCIQKKGRLPFVHFSPQPRDHPVPYQFYLFSEDGQLLDQQPLGPLPYNYPNALIQQANGNYLLSTGKGHLIEFDDAGFIREIPFEEPIIGLLGDRNGGVWISTPKAIYHYPNGLINSEKRELVEETVMGVARMEDYQGGIWIHSETEGLQQIQFPGHRFYTPENGLPNAEVNELAALGDHLWFGDAGNLLYNLDLKNGLLDSISIPAADGSLLTAILFDSVYQRMWIAQRGKLLYSDHGEWRSLSLDGHDLPKAGLRYYLQPTPWDTSSSLMGFVRKQYFLLQDTQITYVSPLLPHEIWPVLRVGDSTFLGSQEGLFIDAKRKVSHLGERFPTFGNPIQNMTVFQGRLWVSVGGKGVYALNRDRILPVTYRGSHIQNGLFLLQGEDRLWISNEKGWYRVDGSASDSRSSFEISGFMGDPFRSMGMSYGPDSSIYSGIYGYGIMKTSFSELEKRPLDPPFLHIAEIKDGELVRTLDSTPLVLESNLLTISYAAPNYTPLDVNYRYRIPGLRDKWTYTKDETLQFLGLPAGRYACEIQARLESQPWSDPVTVQFIVPRPFWATWWFIALVAGLCLLVVYLVAQYRIRIANREKALIMKRLIAEQKALRTKMDPHFVFNVITSLHYLISGGMNKKASEFLEHFSDLMRTTLDLTNHESVSLEAEINFLTAYLQMERLRLEEKFDFLIEPVGRVDLSLQIPTFLIQPLAENAVHHGLKNRVGKGRVAIRFERAEPFLKVTVEDDGVGYQRTLAARSKRTHQRTSHGITTIEERLVLHNGKSGPSPVMVQDLSHSEPVRTGTRVTLLIKLDT